MVKERRCDWQVKLWTYRLGAVWLAALIIGLLIRVPPPELSRDPGPTNLAQLDANCLHSVRGATVPWYVRSRQWQADIRSLTEVWRYITDADLVAQTNSMPLKAGNV